jgi:hypothetical protein
MANMRYQGSRRHQVPVHAFRTCVISGFTSWPLVDSILISPPSLHVCVCKIAKHKRSVMRLGAMLLLQQLAACSTAFSQSRGLSNYAERTSDRLRYGHQKPNGTMAYLNLSTTCSTVSSWCVSEDAPQAIAT